MFSSINNSDQGGPKKLDQSLRQNPRYITKGVSGTGRSRQVHTAPFKAKVAFPAVKELEAMSQLASRDEVHPTRMHQWKKQFLESAEIVFNNGTGWKTPGNEEECS
jgi:transposase